MTDNTAFFDELTPQQERLIACLLVHKTKRDAARAAEVTEESMYRWLRLPAFMAAYRAARWQVSEEAIAKIEIAAPAAADVVINAIGKKGKAADKPRLAMAILDRVFTAHQHIGIEEELNYLRGQVNGFKTTMATAPPIADARPREVVTMMMTNNEQGEADRLRVKWMGLLGHGHEDIDVSLRFNRPETVAEERQYLHIVEEMIAEEMKYPPEHRSLPVEA